MEITCLVTVKTPTTLKNTNLVEKYLELVKEKYTEPKNEKTIGCFVTNIDASTDIIREAYDIQRKKSKRSENVPEKQSKQIDIRTDIVSCSLMYPKL